MRFTRDALLLLSIGGASTLSALALRSAFPSKPEEPLVVVGNASKNLGTLLQDEIAQADFVLRNQSSRAIKITETVRSCGCTEPTFTSLEVPPEQDVVVHLTLKTGINRGHLVSTTTIRYASSGLKDFGQLRIVLVADVLPDYDVTPPALTFGPDSPTTQMVLFKPQMLTDLHVLEAITSNSCLECQISAKAERKTYQVTIRYRPEMYLVDDAPPSVFIKTNSKRQPKYPIPLTIIRAGAAL